MAAVYVLPAENVCVQSTNRAVQTHEASCTQACLDVM